MAGVSKACVLLAASCFLVSPALAGNKAGRRRDRKLLDEKAKKIDTSDHDKCPGMFEVSGHGKTHLIPTGWGDPNASTVEVKGNKLIAQHGSRAYFGETCHPGNYSNEYYSAINLLGKTMSYDVDLQGAGCGCNVAFYLTSMRQNKHASDCHDHYCDANDVCGESCAEIDIMEANTKAFHATLHTQFDHGGFGGGLGGGDGWTGPRDWTGAQYGEGAKCIDTLKPFRVKVSFPLNTFGDFDAMDIELSQVGSPCPLSLHLSEYPGSPELGQALKNGMTPIFSYWSSDKMLWMDGRGEDLQGPCGFDDAAKCMKKRPSVSNFQITTNPERCDERCPVGKCEIFPDGVEEGNCRWFLGSVVGDKYTPSAYHCKITTCSDVPKIDSVSKCWTIDDDEYFYSITDQNFACQTKKADKEEKEEVEWWKKQKEEEKAKQEKEEKDLGHKCPGEWTVPGLGQVSLIPTGWKEGTLGAPVEVSPLHHGRIIPHMNARGYFAKQCTAGKYNHDDYLAVNFLNKRLRYTVDLKGAGCGCNAKLSLASMRQNDQATDCGDYYCNANSDCGVPCAEIDIQEANTKAWHTTLHTDYDHTGKAYGGFGGGDGWNGPRDFDGSQYGEGADCIDTNNPFQVVASFLTDDAGNFKALVVNLTQNGKDCPLSISLKHYDGNADLTAALKAGMTPVINYWSSDALLWLDGQGADYKGKCEWDNPKDCGEMVTFSQFAVEDLDVPIGSSTKEETGTCVGDYIVKKKCVIKFRHLGNEYNGCTAVGTKSHYWCSHDEVYAGKWSWCEPCEEEVADETIASHVVSATHLLMANSKQSSKAVGRGQKCGGLHWHGQTNCEEGFVCQFMNEWDSMCVETQGSGDKCIDGWAPAKECMNSFVYDDTEFTGCSTKDSRFVPGKGWCSLTPKYEGAWRDCKSCHMDGNQVVVIEDVSIRHSSIRGFTDGRVTGFAKTGLVATMCAMVTLALVFAAVRHYRMRSSGNSYSDCSDQRNVQLVSDDLVE